MKIAAAPSFTPIKARGTATLGPPLLSPGGPYCILGWYEDNFVIPKAPAANTLFGPRGATWLPDGSLWVTDTGHHRILGWNQKPVQDNCDADILIGQSAFDREGRNAKQEPTAASVNVPTGICPWGAGLAVADAWNHRVLLWQERPTRHNQPADLILGQTSGQATLANQGAARPSASSLHWPYSVGEIDGKLVVCDTGNRRVLIWDKPTHSGQAADLVLGQSDFTMRDENAGQDVGAAGMRWPHAVVTWQGLLAVADAGNNRVMLWDTWPQTPGQACDRVLGQRTFTGCDHNLADYYPSAAALNMPYALAVGRGRLLVADTANSRLLGWQDTASGAKATWLTGQDDFASKGDNRWGIATRETLCWPYGLACRDQEVVIADSGNNRVLLWNLAE